MASNDQTTSSTIINSTEKTQSADDLTAQALLINKRVAATIATNNILSKTSKRGRKGLNSKTNKKNNDKFLNGKRKISSHKNGKTSKKLKTELINETSIDEEANEEDEEGETDNDNNESNVESEDESKIIINESNKTDNSNEEENNDDNDSQDDNENLTDENENNSTHEDIEKVEEIVNEEEEVVKEKSKRGRKRANTTTEMAVNLKNKYNKTKKQETIKKQQNKRNSLPAVMTKAKNKTKREPKASSKQNTAANVEEDLIKCKNLINELARNENCAPFIEPVDPKTYPDYYELIKQPIDVKTIKQKIKTKQYVIIYSLFFCLFNPI